MINAVPKLNFLTFKEFLETCKTVKQSEEWVKTSAINLPKKNLTKKFCKLFGI